MSGEQTIQRRSVLVGAAAVAAAGALGGAGATAASATPSAAGPRDFDPAPLWRTARNRGLAYGTAWATWMSDRKLIALQDREAIILFTQDDLLWYVLKPTPQSTLDFSYGDKFYALAKSQHQLVLGAHLVWDEGFGDGWTDQDLWGLNRRQASDLLFGVVRREVKHYKGRTSAWIVANEVTDPEGVNGFRTDVPWYNTIGKQYVAEAFHLAHDTDPAAELIINEFGFETTNKYGDEPWRRRKALLEVLDTLLSQGVPVHAVGIQGHLLAYQFAERFKHQAYRDFLREIADRGLHIMITEMDVMDGGLPANPAIRDPAVADVYRRYLDVALDEPAVKAVLTFGLTDKYSWLNEDYPRHDGANRRPLPYDNKYHRKPAYWALRQSLLHAPYRKPLWDLSRG
jgi:endo-1,4-beta-xylanase